MNFTFILDENTSGVKGTSDATLFDGCEDEEGYIPAANKGIICYYSNTNLF